MSLVLTWQLVWILALWFTLKEEAARCAGEGLARVLNNISHSKTPLHPLKDFNNIKFNIIRDYKKKQKQKQNHVF